jgi:hypothetical protein
MSRLTLLHPGPFIRIAERAPKKTDLPVFLRRDCPLGMAMKGSRITKGDDEGQRWRGSRASDRMGTHVLRYSSLKFRATIIILHS